MSPDPLPVFTIGSATNSDVVLADDSVASRHVDLEMTPSGACLVTDAGSGRPTRVVHRGEPRLIRRAVATLEDSLKLGDIEIPMSEVLTAIRLRHPDLHLPLPAPALAAAPGAAVPASQPRPVTPAAAIPADSPPAVPERSPVKKQSTPLAPKVPSPAEPKKSEPLTRSLRLPCPSCHTLTGSLKRYRLFKNVLFLWFFWRAQTAEYTACPACMRRTLLKLTLINLPTANVLWPIVFIRHAVVYAATFSRGHSGKIREMLKT
jgi:hypothetical protein